MERTRNGRGCPGGTVDQITRSKDKRLSDYTGGHPVYVDVVAENRIAPGAWAIYIGKADAETARKSDLERANKACRYANRDHLESGRNRDGREFRAVDDFASAKTLPPAAAATVDWRQATLGLVAPVHAQCDIGALFMRYLITGDNQGTCSWINSS